MLPEKVNPGDLGHRAAHLALKADYEAEHGPMILDREVIPVGGEFPIAWVSDGGEHALLHVHFGLPGEPPGPHDTGHTHHHEQLARAYNERHHHAGDRA
jgi:hypothetical protein